MRTQWIARAPRVGLSALRTEMRWSKNKSSGLFVATVIVPTVDEAGIGARVTVPEPSAGRVKFTFSVPPIGPFAPASGTTSATAVSAVANTAVRGSHVIRRS